MKSIWLELDAVNLLYGFFFGKFIMGVKQNIQK